MSLPSSTKQWILQHKARENAVLGSSNESTFKLVEKPLPSQLESGQVLVQVVALSNDPAQRTWISANIDKARLYVPPVEEGDVMRAGALGKIIASESKTLQVGKHAVLMGVGGWTEYVVTNEKSVRPVEDLPGGLSRTHYLGALGTTGLTAYFGIKDVCQAKKDDVVVVSGAAGATGSMVVQIAKHVIGCKKVIGIAGGAEKCKWVESIGADVCLDYKASNLWNRLKEETPDFVNVYFDNVGGEILDQMLTRMARHSTIAACGAISQYNRDGEPIGIKNWFEIVSNRINVKGFIVLDFLDRLAEGMQALREAVVKGQIKIGEDSETVVPTKFDEVPNTWIKLFESGGKQGKLITKLA